jgi:AraC-like DNA-binding protein
MLIIDFTQGWAKGTIELMKSVKNRKVGVTGRRVSGEAPEYFSTQVSSSRRFYLVLKPGMDSRMSVLSGGWEVCCLEYDLKRSGFPFLALEFVVRGTGRLILNGDEYDLRPGTGFVYGPGIPHRIVTDPGAPMKKYFVVFSGKPVLDLLSECHLLPGTVMHVADPVHINGVFDDLIRYGLSDHSDRNRICQVALQYLIIKIRDLSIPQGQGVTRAFETYQRCRRFIEENCLRNYSLREIADECHVDMAYLCRLFQRFGRESPFQYLQHLRMNRAVDLLKNSGRMVKQVADELHFSDQYNFSRAFKKFYGISPVHLLKVDGGE